jgi:predicted dehydrogenase
VSNTHSDQPSRRDLLNTGTLAAAGALAGAVIPAVHAAADETIQVALVGCGGRGTGAAAQAMNTKSGPTKLVAMADVFERKLKDSYADLNGSHSKQVDVPIERRFIGFDGYKKAMDALRPGDVVILATPPAFRWVHFTYAIKKKLNVFMEKPISVDGPTSRRMFKLGEEAAKAGLKVGVGLMCRHCVVREELFDRIKKGQIGELTLLRAYRLAGPTASAFTLPRPKNDKSELLYQVKNFHSFLWCSGGAFSDFLIHNIDECCWMKDAWPVKAQGVGGRHYRRISPRQTADFIDQNFDSYAVEYTFADGAKLLMEGRTIPGCHNEFASYAHGTKGSAIISESGHTPAKSKLFKNQAIDPRKKDNVIWAGPRREPDPYQTEWDRLIKAIRENKAHNEVKRGTEASLVTAMGRMASHTGQIITYKQMLECKHEFAPGVDKLTMMSAAPIKADTDGKYPVPKPGILKDREYEYETVEP